MRRGTDLGLPEGGVQLNDSLLTAGQVAKLLGVPTSWVYEQSRRGRIPTVTLGRYRRYRADAIAEWVEQLEASGVVGLPTAGGDQRSGGKSADHAGSGAGR